ncbi:MAG: hypothetical protein KDC90_16380 [Ignavibacteriae bacterium]|nr:hypothetical protein [Ignavibacteriota bacterium]
MLGIIRKYLVFIFIILFINSCNAPRNNPLDPNSTLSKISTLEGTIKTISVPQLPIENAKIFWQNEGIISFTDGNGFFRIENIEPKDGWIFIEKDNFSTDSLFITFENQKKISLTIFLNSIPKISDLQFYSITKNKFPNTQVYNLEIKSKITDDENDIDSVFIELPELNAKKQLLYNASTKYYENSISLEDLKITSIDIIIGKEFIINVFDSDRKKFLAGKANIKRIIKEEILTKAPSGKDTVFTSNPLLEWFRFKPGFQFRYLVQIYTDEVPAILVWQKEIISSEIQYLTDVNLSSGDYFWVIWAIDEFENRTQSKPASFIVP